MEVLETELQQLLNSRVRTERRKYFWSILLIIIPIIIGLSWWLFTFKNVQRLQEQKKQLGEQVEELIFKTSELIATQDDILEFLEQVTSKEKIQLLDPNVDWEKTKNRIISLSPGKRKQAVFAAILLAWQDIPFELNEESLSLGFDSPRFLRFVLSQVGIAIESEPGIPLSVILMSSFEKVEDPLPGDLMFYRGQVGNFGFIYLSEGRPDGQGVGVGTLQEVAPLQIIDTSNINTPFFPFIGYFRVNYPNE